MLIAEDNFMVAMDLAFECEELGAEVVGPFARVEDALVATQAESPDGAILDVNLLDGYVTPLAQKLIELNIPVVFCTGVSLPAELQQRYPAAQVFIKPTASKTLADALEVEISKRFS
ncbi:response regulator [Mesorhizobium sp. NBSH29]|uniref:response regulator n=1 Tax=Mesorhizobium sp. NBSH29 TaxID=2654249 RepID=UPI0018965FCF|nr:response regulator [Mesorhizobium sp. NBSH29]